MCENAAPHSPDLDLALARVGEQWRSLPDPWGATGQERTDLRRAVMAARREGACWGDIGAAVGEGKDALRGHFGCMPRSGERRGDGECSGHGGRHGHQVQVQVGRPAAE